MSNTPCPEARATVVAPARRALSLAIVLWTVSSALAAAALADEPPGVVAARVTRLAFPLTVEGLGTARANESVEIRSKVTETLTAIRFEEGQYVKAGAVLVELNDADARANVARAQAALIESEGRHTRNLELVRSNLVSESQLETSAAQRDADRAALEAAKLRLADTVIRAPFAGRIGLRRVSPGALVGPSTMITTLDDTDVIKVDFDVPETALSYLAEALPVTAHSAAWPDSTFEGAVASIDTRVDPVSRMVTVRAKLPNGRHLLRPGMFLTVELLRRDVSALMLPEQAIVPEQSRQYVFAVDDDGLVDKREVRTGRRMPGYVELIAGIEVDTLVVVEGTQKAKPGSHVRVLRELEVSP